VLAGIVVDGAGAPVPGVAVRWRPSRAEVPAGMPARRTVRGAALDLPLVAQSGDDGVFALETDRFGAGTVALADGSGQPIATEAIAGRRREGYRLQR